VAVTVDELVLKITLSNEKTAAELGKINDELAGLKKNSKLAADGVSGTAASFAKFAVIGTAAIASIKGLVSTISGLTNSFFEAEDSITKLRQALEITGSTSVQATVNQFTALGDSLESLGVASTEQVLSLARLGTAADQTAEQTTKLIKAAADLSVARSIPLESAFKALSSSLKGSSGALANFLPEIKNLTDAQNKAGLAIDYVSASLGGFSARNLETYSGKIAVLKSRLGDLGEEIGTIIAKIFGLDESIQGTTSYLESLKNTLIQNRDTFVALGKVMTAPFIYVAKVISDLAISAGGSFGFLKIVMGKFLEGLGLVITAMSRLQGIADSFGKSITDFGKEMAESGKNMATASKEMLLAIEPMKKAPTVLDNTSEAAKKAAESMKKIKDQMMTPEQVQAWDTLKNKVQELAKAQAISGLEGAAMIRAKAIADKAEIDALVKKLELGRKLTEEQKAAATKAKTSIDAAASADINKTQLDTLTQIESKNKEIETATKSINATRRELIQFELDNQLRLLNIEKEKIDLQDKASLAAIERQKELLRAQAVKKASTGQGAGFEQMAKIGGDIAGKISEVFSTGALEMVGGAMSMVGAVVSAINTMLDFIPNFINGIADLFNKLTDLPNVFLKAFQGLFSGIIRFISEFIPNLIKMIPQLLSDIGNFIQGAVDAFIGLLADFPKILMRALDSLPTIIENLISNLISAAPEIMAGVISFLVEKAPQIALRIVKLVAIDVPIAIVKGIIEGIKKIGKVIQNLFSGKALKLPKVQIDSKGIEKIGQKLAGSASRLFQVQDLTESAKDPIAKMTEMISGSFAKGSDYIKQAWMWVYEKIIKPIFDGLKAVWMFVWDNIIQPIISGFKALFTWINENIFRPVISAFMQVFTWINENIFQPLVSGLMTAFLWINENIVQPIASAFMATFTFLEENLLKPLGEIGAKIAEPIKKAFEGIGDFFKNIADAFMSLFKFDFNGFANSMSSALQGALQPIFNLLKVPVNAVIDLINSLKLPGFEVGFTVLGRDIKFGWGETDLVPGDIQRLAKGGMVQAAGLGTDTVPAMLTPGEFIMSRPAVQSIGLDNLRAMNNGSSLGGTNTYNMSFSINVDAKTNLDEGYIRGTLIPRMSEELKRASLDGKFVLSQKGIR
jgi:phage-related protein